MTLAAWRPSLWRKVLVVLSFVVKLSSGIPANEECRNPLFETHWYQSTGLHTQMAEKMRIRTDLQLCPAYNGFYSCCWEPFEGEQLKHYRFWEAIIAAKIKKAAEARDAAAHVRRRDIYDTGRDSDREQLDAALLAYEVALDPANHAGCFAGMMTYVAGMLCFACDPQWVRHVMMDGSRVISVILTESSCEELWRDCGRFAAILASLKQAVLDSRLAAFSVSPYENFEMFSDQEALCDWMHDAVAMHPFTTPSEVDRESAPMDKTVSRRLASQDGTVPYDVMIQGRASGFDVLWNGVSAGSTGSPAWTARPLMATAMMPMLWLFRVRA